MGGACLEGSPPGVRAGTRRAAGAAVPVLNRRSDRRLVRRRAPGFRTGGGPARSGPQPLVESTSSWPPAGVSVPSPGVASGLVSAGSACGPASGSSPGKLLDEPPDEPLGFSGLRSFGGVGRPFAGSGLRSIGVSMAGEQPPERARVAAVLGDYREYRTAAAGLREYRAGTAGRTAENAVTDPRTARSRCSARRRTGSPRRWFGPPCRAAPRSRAPPR